MKTLLVEGDRGRRRRDDRPRRSRAECRQGAEAAGRGVAAAHGERRSRSSPTAGCEPGFIGPVGLEVQGLRRPRGGRTCRTSSAAPTNATCTSPASNWGRDLPEGEVVDLRNVVAGDPSPTGKGTLGIARGIEVGHIFQLGRKYSEAMNATVLDEQGKSVAMVMGCYGIGVTRVVAAAIEQNHDERGIIWPEPIAPFDVSLIPINLQKSARVQAGDRSAVRGTDRGRLRGRARRSRRAARREVRRRRAARHSAPHRHRRQGPRARRARIQARAGDGLAADVPWPKWRPSCATSGATARA